MESNLDVKEIVERFEKTNPDVLILAGLMPLQKAYEHCTVMFNHGGMGTIQEAARFGVPQLCVPIRCMDQVDNTLMVQDAKLGQIQSVSSFWEVRGMSSFMETVKELCDNVVYRRNAEKHARKYADMQHNGLSAVLVILTKFYHKMRKIEEEQEPSVPQPYGEGSTKYKVMGYTGLSASLVLLASSIMGWSMFSGRQYPVSRNSTEKHINMIMSTS